MSRGFQQLEIWQKGKELLLALYAVKSKFVSYEARTLFSQLFRSANGIIANIAESDGRYYFKDKIRILYIARGEATELMSHLIIAKELTYLHAEHATWLIDEYNNLIKRISSYINYLELRNHELSLTHATN